MSELEFYENLSIFYDSNWTTTCHKITKKFNKNGENCEPQNQFTFVATNLLKTISHIKKHIDLNEFFHIFKMNFEGSLEQSDIGDKQIGVFISGMYTYQEHYKL